MMLNNRGLPDYLSPSEVAEILNVHINTVYNLCKKGEIPSFKFGNSRRIKTESLINWIDEKEKEGD